MPEHTTSADDRELETIQRELARAWLQHDRAFVESVLAPEWGVTQADGSILDRAAVLGPFFETVAFDSNVIDDVRVMVYGDTRAGSRTGRS